jgi:putative salt-induced outer membrane protein YdiY
MLNATLRWFLAAGVWMTVSGSLPAAEAPGNTHRLELANGEVLVGALVAEEEAVIVFRSQTWGEVRVPKAGTNLGVIASESAEPVAQAPGWVKAQPVNAEPAAPSGAPVNEAIPQAAPQERAKWRRSFEAGYTYQSTGSLVSTHSTYLRAEITRETKTGLAGIEGRYLYGEQNSVRNTDKAEAAFRIREKIKDRLNVRNNFSYSFDNLKDLSNQFEEVLGLSYEVFNTPKLRYAIGPGLAVQYSEPALGKDGFKYLGDISHEFKWQIVPRVSLSNISSVLFRPDQLEDHRFRSNSVLSGQITENVSVNLRYEYEYEAIRPVASGQSDNRVFTTLGYVF